MVRVSKAVADKVDDMTPQEALKLMRKEFGDDSWFLLDDDSSLDVKVRSSGSLLLDLALGGGFAQGRVASLIGQEKSGKTTLLCLAIAEAQQSEPDKLCAIIDQEKAFNPAWAKKLGVDTSKLLISQPDTHAEAVYDMLEFMIETGKYSIIGLDSVAALISKDELENEDWEKESRVGGIAKLNARCMRKIVNSGKLNKSGTSLIMINQLQDKIGGFSMYGTPTTTSGGKHICRLKIG